ncbi:endonuclease/exonuclease/phosphatase family protein [Daejeonella sp.]|uniref:endonuclease/exonuclease/phosphatase family protein n=1 Tax=Daejeonella sp. TaxID=2805397 RepID=UPI00398394DC
MSYNIHIGIPPTKPGVTDIDAIVKTIKNQDPDIIALQEVDVNTTRTGKINEAAIIAKKLKMDYFFAKAIDYAGGDYGVAILSKYPLSETKIHRLTTVEGTKGEPRVMATAKITLKKGLVIRFGSTHLDAQASPLNREKQIAEIVEISSSETLPFIIAGDFNAQQVSSVIKKLDESFTRTCQDCAPTFPVVNPGRAIDFIAFSNTSKIKVISHSVVQEHYASDHLPVVALLQIGL